MHEDDILNNIATSGRLNIELKEGRPFVRRIRDDEYVIIYLLVIQFMKKKNDYTILLFVC